MRLQIDSLALRHPIKRPSPNIPLLEKRPSKKKASIVSSDSPWDPRDFVTPLSYIINRGVAGAAILGGDGWVGGRKAQPASGKPLSQKEIEIFHSFV
jgi:hypothetical protein